MHNSLDETGKSQNVSGDNTSSLKQKKNKASENASSVYDKGVEGIKDLSHQYDSAVCGKGGVPNFPDHKPSTPAPEQHIPGDKGKIFPAANHQSASQKENALHWLQKMTGMKFPSSGGDCAAFLNRIVALRLPNAEQNKPYRFDIPLANLIKESEKIRITGVGIDAEDSGLKAELLDSLIRVSGTPRTSGAVSLSFDYLETKTGKAACPFTIIPDPKTLWKDLPVDENAPYQTPNMVAGGLFDINGKNLIVASKRGRSHAHTGRFRDDSFSFCRVPEYGWLIVAVSDGAGSAEFSRKGAEIACSSFINDLCAKLSSKETNDKIDSLDKNVQKQEETLKWLLFSTAFEAYKKIKAEADGHNIPVKKFSATLLGYIAKKMEDGWLFVSVGIGDGAIAILDRENHVHLLNAPDGGEQSGETRFLTTPVVWEGKEFGKRTFSIRIPDFQGVFSMTDGVSDPMFESDNALRDSTKWVEFWNKLKNSEEHPIHFDVHSETTYNELLSWLDFWAYREHDDRTLSILY